MAGINNSFMTSIPYNNSGEVSEQKITSKTQGKNYLEKDDFFKLLAAQMQNQDMTNPMDQSEFMNQLTMMSSIQAMEEITNISVVSYAASLVGKDVTIGEIGTDGKINEIYGTVTATGVYDGEQVIFVNEKSYKLSQIMVVGKLPESDDTNAPTDSTSRTMDGTSGTTDGSTATTDSADVTTDSTPSGTDSSGDNVQETPT